MSTRRQKPTPPSTAATTFQDRWNEMYKRLVAFKEEHGHCLVPNRYPKDKRLGAWVSAQRRHYKALKSATKVSTPLTIKREQMLNDLDFDWSTPNPRHVSWEDRYQQLEEFNDTYGHTQVPMNWSGNPSLANWVSAQRQEYKQIKKGHPSKLTKDQVDQLNHVGFVWKAQRGGRHEKLTTLLERDKSNQSSSNKDVPAETNIRVSVCSPSNNDRATNRRQALNWEVSASGPSIWETQEEASLEYQMAKRELPLSSSLEGNPRLPQDTVRRSRNSPSISSVPRVVRLPDMYVNSPTLSQPQQLSADLSGSLRLQMLQQMAYQEQRREVTSSTLQMQLVDTGSALLTFQQRPSVLTISDARILQLRECSAEQVQRRELALFLAQERIQRQRWPILPAASRPPALALASSTPANECATLARESYLNAVIAARGSAEARHDDMEVLHSIIARPLPGQASTMTGGLTFTSSGLPLEHYVAVHRDSDTLNTFASAPSTSSLEIPGRSSLPETSGVGTMDWSQQLAQTSFYAAAPNIAPMASSFSMQRMGLHSIASTRSQHGSRRQSQNQQRDHFL